jgi:hypothetical protein
VRQSQADCATKNAVLDPRWPAFRTRSIPTRGIDPGYRSGDTSTAVSHAITWVGQVGGAGQYLIIDSRVQPETLDEKNNMVPTGVQIRPFTADSRYFKSFSHANRILHE